MTATIKVITYKNTGKYYDEKESHLSTVHECMQGYKLVSLFESNDESVHPYSGVSSNFSSPDFFHVIEVTYPDNINNFCNFLLLRDGTRFGQ